MEEVFQFVLFRDVFTLFVGFFVWEIKWSASTFAPINLHELIQVRLEVLPNVKLCKLWVQLDDVERMWEFVCQLFLETLNDLGLLFPWLKTNFAIKNNIKAWYNIWKKICFDFDNYCTFWKFDINLNSDLFEFWIIWIFVEPIVLLSRFFYPSQNFRAIQHFLASKIIRASILGVEPPTTPTLNT